MRFIVSRHPNCKIALIPLSLNVGRPKKQGIYLIQLKRKIWRKKLLLIFSLSFTLVTENFLSWKRFCLNRDLLCLPKFRMYVLQRLMTFFPLFFEILKLLIVSLVSDRRSIVFFHSSNTFMFRHHFLEMTSALSRSSSFYELRLRFEDLTESRYQYKYFLFLLEAKIF